MDLLQAGRGARGSLTDPEPSGSTEGGSSFGGWRLRLTPVAPRLQEASASCWTTFHSGNASQNATELTCQATWPPVQDEGAALPGMAWGTAGQQSVELGRGGGAGGGHLSAGGGLWDRPPGQSLAARDPVPEGSAEPRAM